MRVPFEPIDILDEYEGPVTFTFKNDDGMLLLAHIYTPATDDGPAQYLATPFDEEGVQELRTGRLTIRDALMDQRWGFLVTGEPWAQVTLKPVKLTSLPQDLIPGRNSVLRMEFLPLLTLRLLGSNLQGDSVPVSVVRGAIKGTEGAIKAIGEYIADTSASGGDVLSAIQDLRVQRMAFASFEVAVGSAPAQMPQAPVKAPLDPLVRMKKLLTGAFRTVVERPKDIDYAGRFDNEEAGKVALQAILEMTPPGYGPVEEAEVSGRLVGGPRPHRLDRNARTYIRSFFKPKAEEVIDLVGLIDMPSLNQTFQVRPIDGKAEKFSYDDEFIDPVIEAFRSRQPHRVVGIKPARGSAKLAALSPYNP